MKKITLLIFISFAVLIGCPPPGTDPTQSGGDNKIAVTSVKITAETTRISRGTSLQLNVEVLPANASDKSVNWATSDPNTATVNSGLVFAADDAKGKVTITAVSTSNPEVKDTIELEIPEISEVVYRNGNGYRLASLFDFDKTGLGKEWTYPTGSTSSNALEPQQPISGGVLVVEKLDGQKDDSGISYPLVLSDAFYNSTPPPEDKPIAYVEISAKLNTDGVGSGIGVGIGTNEIGTKATNDNGRGWANEFFNDHNNNVTMRLAQSRGGQITIKPDTYHLFGISFTESKHESFMDGNLVSSANPGQFGLAGFNTYYLYFGTENNENANKPVTVTVDYVAFYYLDEEIEIIEVKEPTIIPARVTVEGKELKLTHYDPFDSMETLKENWDIGNPGINRPEIGNEGKTTPDFIPDFGDGISGYSGDRYKQPYWSPEAVDIKDGELLIKVYFDPTIDNLNEDSNGKVGYIPGETANLYNKKGYGVAGAIHSKRQFPSGLFVTKIKHSWGDRAGKTNAHWDAWWAESNNPFSRDYGKKTLFMPAGGETKAQRAEGETRPNAIDTDNNGSLDTYTNDVPAGDRGLNGQQVYEYDMYEWVSNNNSQWQVLHSWSWYGGYPGWEDRLDSKGGDNNYWSTADNLRDMDNGGGTASFSSNYSDGGQASRGDWFYLAMLVTPEKVVMWNFPKDWDWNFDAPVVGGILGRSYTEGKRVLNTGDSAFGTSGIKPFRNADTYAPIQVKYSSELGDWGNKHDRIYNARNELTPDNPDIMHAEFFAFYAWDTSGKYTSYENDVDG